MKTSFPASGHSVFVLFAMAACLFTLTAQAQAVRAPASKNLYLAKIASAYNALEYEQAIELLPKAEKKSSKKETDLLWLDLMSGVLHYSVSDKTQSDAAFKRALERAPDTHLPIPNPSYTLLKRFESLRSEHFKTRKITPVTTAPAAPAPPAAPKKLTKLTLVKKLRQLEDLSTTCAGGSLSAPLDLAFRTLYDQATKAESDTELQALGATIDTWIKLLSACDADALASATTPAKPDAPKRGRRASGSPQDKTSLLRRAISHDVLDERIRRMKEWLILQTEKGTNPQINGLLTRLNEILRMLDGTQTSHERMAVALALDGFEASMAAHAGWTVQGSDAEVNLDKE